MNFILMAEIVHESVLKKLKYTEHKTNKHIKLSIFYIYNKKIIKKNRVYFQYTISLYTIFLF